MVDGPAQKLRQWDSVHIMGPRSEPAHTARLVTPHLLRLPARECSPSYVLRRVDNS